MKLYKQNITAPVGQIPNLSLYVFSDSLGDPFEDISSIENINLFGMNTGRDYKFCRKEIAAQMIVQGGWEALTLEEKKICARWFVVEKTQRAEVITTDDQVLYGRFYHRSSVDARQKRYDAAVSEVLNRLTDIEAYTLLSILQADRLDTNYIQYGAEGTEAGDPIEGIYDYIRATDDNGNGWTKYALNGLAVSGFTPTGMSLSDLVDRLMEIFKDGEY